MPAQLKLRTVYQWIQDLSTPEGINASSKDGVYGCIFGRDSAITFLKILESHTRRPNPQLLDICRRGLTTLIALQGKEFNIESGEEPGKFIHEFRRDSYEHLLASPHNWYLYPDKTLRSYDSLDSTPLTLIAMYKYWQITRDTEFLLQALPAVERGLKWIYYFGDKDKDKLIEYELPKSRKHGGLKVHSWTDSHESILRPDGTMPVYPIAPVEAQAVAWQALRLWADFYTAQAPTFAKRLQKEAEIMKKMFNVRFIIRDEELFFAAQALDGYKRKILTITGNPLICLWASVRKGNKRESIIDDVYIPDVVERGFRDDLFDMEGGIRTMSTKSPTFIRGKHSYHNGSFWPMLNSLIYEGLRIWGYSQQAETLKDASLRPILHFGTPIELYIREDGQYDEYQNPAGHRGCRYQAWSAAATLDFLT